MDRAFQSHLHINDVAIDRGGVMVVEQVSLSVKSGSAALLTGVNGAGKTTLLRAIAGLLPLAHGSVRLGLDELAGEHCHFVGHAAAVKPGLTVRENLAFWWTYLASAPGAAAPIAAPAPLELALEALSLSHLAHLPAQVLSAGQRRRVALARLLLAPRPIWLLDEPTTALDAASTARLMSMIHAHTQVGGIAIIATHHALALSGAIDYRVGASHK